MFSFINHDLQNYGRDQRAAFRVFNGENVGALRKFLDKEEQRRQEAENKNMKFLPRADDKLDLY
jgi:F-box and leucine-rich repeat protein GRR1